MSVGGVIDHQPRPLLPAVSAWAASETDVLGDWQTGGGEGWQITLLPNHVVAVYLEGVVESKPTFSTWKLTGDHVIIHDASVFRLGNDREYSGDLMVLRVKNHVVLLPKENLALVQRYGLASFLCFWHLTQKGLDALPKGAVDSNKVLKQIQHDQKKHQ